GGQGRQTAATGGDGPARGVGEARAQGGGDADPAIGARRAADAQQDLLDAEVERAGDDEPDAIGVGPLGLQRDVGDLRQAIGLGGLDDGGGSVGGDPEGRRGGSAEGIDGVHGARSGPPDGQQRVEGALSAVGEGQFGNGGVGKDRASAAGQGRS